MQARSLLHSSDSQQSSLQQVAEQTRRVVIEQLAASASNSDSSDLGYASSLGEPLAAAPAQQQQC